MAADCNECNEAFSEARVAVHEARRLALVADNAIANGDPVRARTALRDLHDAIVASAAEAERQDTANTARRR